MSFAVALVGFSLAAITFEIVQWFRRDTTRKSAPPAVVVPGACIAVVLLLTTLTWLEKAVGLSPRFARLPRWLEAGVFALLILVVALLGRGEHAVLGFFPLGFVTILTVLGLLLVSGGRAGTGAN